MSNYAKRMLASGASLMALSALLGALSAVLLSLISEEVASEPGSPQLNG